MVKMLLVSIPHRDFSRFQREGFYQREGNLVELFQSLIGILADFNSAPNERVSIYIHPSFNPS